MFGTYKYAYKLYYLNFKTLSPKFNIYQKPVEVQYAGTEIWIVLINFLYYHVFVTWFGSVL